MTRENFVATAWNNGNPGPSGAGYGLKIGIADRDRFFDRSWQTVTLRLAEQGLPRIVMVNCAKASFWNSTCRELIGKEIGRWLIDNGFAPWPKGTPPKFLFSPVEARLFDVTALGD